MAKVKNIQTLTIEEKLEQAFVPKSEQPYTIPKNWVWTKLGRLVDIKTGKEDANFATEQGKYFFFTCAEDPLLCDTSVFYGESVLIAGNGAFHVNYYDGEFNAYQRTYVIQNFKAVNGKFVYYHTLRDIQNITSGNRGSTIRYIRLGDLTGSLFPLPPIPEQHRIVARIESLFEKLDHSRELVQSALDSFESRKAAILHKAFTGELTAKWREKNGVELESWVEKRLGDCGLLERGRSKHRPRNASELFGGPYPFIQTGDVANADVYITKHNQTLSEIGLNQSKLFPKGTLCITIAANIGDVAILSYDSCFPDSVVGFTPNEYTNSKFVYYLMNILQKQLEAEAPATAQKNINLKVLNEITFRCPRIIEQQEIVRILDNLLEKEQQTQEQLEPILDQIDMMKKSILARAFRGELGTNDPSEESAMEFLKEILVKGNQS